MCQNETATHDNSRRGKLESWFDGLNNGWRTENAVRGEFLLIAVDIGYESTPFQRKDHPHMKSTMGGVGGPQKQKK